MGYIARGAGCTAAKLLAKQADGLIIIDALIRTQSMEAIAHGLIVGQLQQRCVAIRCEQQQGQ